jgi:hypothetical protein
LLGTTLHLGGDKLKETVLVYVVGNEEQWELPHYLRSTPGFQESERMSQAVRFFSEKEVAFRGGVDGLEYDLGDKCDWYARTGSIQWPATTGGRIVAPPAAASSLFDDWVARGRPREFGWRYKHIELYRAATEAIMIALSLEKNPASHSVISLTPELDEIPHIFQRLEAGEIVEMDVQVKLRFCYVDDDKFFYAGNDYRDFGLSMWCEKTVHDFKVKAEVQAGEAPQRPGDWYTSNLDKTKGEGMIYDHVIEIVMDDALSALDDKYREMVKELHTVRRMYIPQRTKDSQEWYLLDLLWKRACVQVERCGSNGYVGPYCNCAFNLLYGVFGIDILAFLFDQAWFPGALITPFRVQLFLERLSVLERAVDELKDGTKTPVLLPETAHYIDDRMGPKLTYFDEKKHRLLLSASLHELRDFGALGLSLQGKDKPLTVGIHMPLILDEEVEELSAKQK